MTTNTTKPLHERMTERAYELLTGFAAVIVLAVARFWDAVGQIGCDLGDEDQDD
jgi:hypothetical protein